MPTLSNEDYITLAAQELIYAIKVAGMEQTLVLQEGHKDAFVKLANIFSTKIASQFQPPRVNNIPGNVNAPSPRVTKSNKPTASPNLNNIKAVHQQKTRSNTTIPTRLILPQGAAFAYKVQHHLSTGPPHDCDTNPIQYDIHTLQRFHQP